MRFPSSAGQRKSEAVMYEEPDDEEVARQLEQVQHEVGAKANMKLPPPTLSIVGHGV